MKMRQAFYLLQAIFILMSIGQVKANNASTIATLKNTDCLFSAQLQVMPPVNRDIAGNEIMVSDSRKALNRKVWTFSTSDIFFRKALTPFDVTRQDYVETVRLLHPYAVAFSEGKTSDWARQVIGDTLVLGGAGNGFNIPSWVPTDILQGMSSHKFFIEGKSYDFFNAYVRLIHELPTKGYILGNIMTGTCKEVIWMINRTDPEYVQLGLEQMRGEAFSKYWNKDASKYKQKFNIWADSIRTVYPDVKIIADIPPSHSNSQTDQAWIKELQTGLKADGVRDYWHLHWMSRGQFSGNYEKDKQVMYSIFSTTLPDLIAKNKRLFPGKELIIDQWSVSLTGDGGRNPYKRTFFGTSYIPRMVQFMIEFNRDHDDAIASAKYENLKQLIGNKGTKSMEFEVTRMIANLFSEPANVLDIKSALTGTILFGVKAGNQYKLILLNDQEEAVQLPKQFNFDGRLLTIHIKEALASPGPTSTEWSSYSSNGNISGYSIVYITAQ